VGTADGSDVARKLGDDVGTADGADVGRILGLEVGCGTGTNVSFGICFLEGFDVGWLVG
jgi:hypothetical protein